MKRFIEDLIDRLELARKYALLSAENGIYPDYIKMDKAVAKAYGKAIDIVNELAEKYKNDWIPCSERLPDGEKFRKVLVTDKEGIMAVCYFLEETKVFKVSWDGEIFEGAVAWQPLPTKYKEVLKSEDQAD